MVEKLISQQLLVRFHRAYMHACESERCLSVKHVKSNGSFVNSGRGYDANFHYMLAIFL